MALTKQQTEAAIDYNKQRGYCESEIKLTQKTVGATVDGIWGPETVQKVADWQPTRQLTPDGKVGPETWAAITAAWELKPTEPPPAGAAEVGCGLAAYDQTFPGHTPDEAMQVAYDAALALGCKELRFWSSEWLIDDMGNKGNSYSGPWLARQEPPEGVTIGAWIDDPIKAAKSIEFASRLLSMHVTRAALMINRSNTRLSDVPWLLRWDRDELSEIATTYAAAGIECVATCWPQPSKSQIDAMCEDMAWILPLIGSTTFEVDTEGNWTTKFLRGFSSMQEASEYLAARMRELVGPEGTLELTTYTYHTENSKNAKLAPMMDRLLPQAYSVRHRTESGQPIVIEWNDSLGPGRHQKLAVNRAKQAAAA
jgi:hypothetical protein